jgi:hypothetical protein
MRQRLSASALEAPLVAVIAVFAGLLVIARPGMAFAAFAGMLALVVLSRLSIRYIVAGLLAYLVVEAVVLTHVPQNGVVFARYAPEIAVFGVVFARLLPKLNAAAGRMGTLWGALLAVVTVWVGSAIWNGTALSTVAIGFRSELRFLPLLALPLLSRTPRRDALFYGRFIVALGMFQALVAAAEYVGGTGLRSALAPDYQIVVGGTLVAGTLKTDTSSIFGTFANYNGLGIFLALAWIILASAGSEKLGLRRGQGWAAGALILGGIAISGSRESAVAVVISALVIGRLRFRLPVVHATALLVLTAALASPILANVSRGAPSSAVSYRNLSKRWASVFSPATWSANYYSNFRLFLLVSDVKFVAKESPVFGFGIGSVSDRRGLKTKTSPVFRTFAGSRAAAFSYLYDGGWALVLVEVGFVGIAALALLLFQLMRIALRVSRVHWIGTALLTTLVANVVLGFFAPVLQLRLPSAMLWLLVGLALAIAHSAEDGKTSEGDVPDPNVDDVSPVARSRTRTLAGRRSLPSA